MLRNLNRIWRYNFSNGGFEHYIETYHEITKKEQENLDQILASFPHCCDDDWSEKFSKLNFKKFCKNLLFIASNAYDSSGNTVLGIACEYGEVESVERLINIGARLDTPDHKENKLALHWAICNRLSCQNSTSYRAAEVVKYLLDKGARTDISCYLNMTPLEYAIKEKFQAATDLIANHIGKLSAYTRGATNGLFKDAFPSDVIRHISFFFNRADGARIAQTSKNAYNSAKGEEERITKKFI